MEIYPVDILIHIINIIVTYVLLRLLIFKPVRKFMDARAARIQKDMGDAKAASERAEQTRSEYEAKLADSEAQARQILREGEQKAVESSEAIIAQAKLQADQILSEAKNTAEADRKRTMDSLQGQIADTAVDIAQQILQREVSLDDNRAVIDEFFKKVEQ